MSQNGAKKLILSEHLKNVDFSVLMSVYYKETSDNLRIALDSIIEQTLIPTEIVLVKDGLLNESLDAVIDDYRKKCSFLKVYELKENVGLGRALNEGMRYCKYNIIARMDTDDFSERDRFEKQMSVLIKRPELDVVGSNVCEYDKKLKSIVAVKSVPESDSDIKKYLKKRNPFNHMSVVYRKDKVLAVGGYIDCPYFEDYFLWCRMARNGCNFFNIQEPLVRVRAGADMIERRGGFSYAKDVLHFEKEILKLRTISLSGFLYNSFVRIAVALFPNNLRQSFYLKRLRKNDSGAILAG